MFEKITPPIFETDPSILQCCHNSSQQPYIGVDEFCQKSAIFCMQHSCHTNREGLIHQTMPLKGFKRSLLSKKFLMQEKIDSLLESFNSFMDKLIEQIRELKLRKSVELSMLWLRQLAEDENEYELMRKVYRMDFRDLTCQHIHSIYYKILHNDVYLKEVGDIKCYEGLSTVLHDLTDNGQAIKVISDKVTEIQGLISDGKVLRKLLSGKRELNSSLKQILLEQPRNQNHFIINYHKAVLHHNSTDFMSVFSKYPILSHVACHITINTKYSNILIGVCTEQLKKSNKTNNLHYNVDSIVYHCNNGNTYKNGMFVSESAAHVKGLKQIVMKLRLTDKQLILMTKEKVLMRTAVTQLTKSGSKLFIHALARTKGDSFEFQRESQVSAVNIADLSPGSSAESSSTLVYQPYEYSQESKKSSCLQLIEQPHHVHCDAQRPILNENSNGLRSAEYTCIQVPLRSSTPHNADKSDCNDELNRDSSHVSTVSRAKSFEIIPPLNQASKKLSLDEKQTKLFESYKESYFEQLSQGMNQVFNKMEESQVEFLQIPDQSKKLDPNQCKKTPNIQQNLFGSTGGSKYKLRVIDLIPQTNQVSELQQVSVESITKNKNTVQEQNRPQDIKWKLSVPGERVELKKQGGKNQDKAQKSHSNAPAEDSQNFPFNLRPQSRQSCKKQTGLKSSRFQQKDYLENQFASELNESGQIEISGMVETGMNSQNNKDCLRTPPKMDQMSRIFSSLVGSKNSIADSDD